ncbi:hypothetical protein BN1051_01378 [Arthrobacter saudimassiliensis]|uniref:Glycosyltransferase 2-like domain-containing protein n=1 Tax=Arthrobacter saudimassiliensis TaxID=1461584 RepID=A0A078MRM3_9MICC|nr:hypothetical protein BN1051_01378 [Arthrobacter saudimassiliensis]
MSVSEHELPAHQQKPARLGKPAAALRPVGTGRPKISFVLPVFNEADNLSKLHAELCTAMDPVDCDLELIFVNDGSTDDSLPRLLALRDLDRRIVVLDLARNYGQQVAITAGLDAATGNAVIVMDADLQDPPAVSVQLIDKWRQGYDVAYAQRRTRQDNWFKKATANIFYRLLHRLADVDIPRNTGDFRILDRRVVEELKKFEEKDRFLRGMVSYVGFSQTAVPFDRPERYAGTSHYSLRKLVKVASDGFLGFSTFPLTLISRVGYAVALLSVVGVLYVLVQKLFFPQLLVAGWAFIVISVLFVGGLQLIMLGLLGSYTGRIYRQVQNRPLYCLKGHHPAGTPEGR